MIRGIIFDLDGTLIDSMSVWNKIDREFLFENGITEPPDDISEIMRKMTVDESAEYFVSQFKLRCTKEYVIGRIEELVRIQYEEKISLKPGVIDLLDFLDEKKIEYGIATATYRRLAEAVLKRHGILERFSFLLTDSEYPEGKNFPGIFFGGAKKLNCLPAEILVVEDSLHCIETAVKSGFITAGIYDEVSDLNWNKIVEISAISADNLLELKRILSRLI